MFGCSLVQVGAGEDGFTRLPGYVYISVPHLKSANLWTKLSRCFSSWAFPFKGTGLPDLA